MSIKNIKYAICIIIFILIGCQAEEEFIQQSNQKNFRIKKLTEAEFMKKAPKAFGKINLLKNNLKDNYYQRTVAVNNEFKVYTDEIVEITKGNSTSYTLPIYRDNETNYVENLVLTLQQDNTYSAKIVTYNLSETEKALLQDGIFIDASKGMQVQNLDNGTNLANTILAKGNSNNCFDIQIEYEMCCHNVHSTLSILNGVHCTCPSPPTGYTYVIAAVPCQEDHGGGGGSGGGDDPFGNIDPPGDGDNDIGNNDGGGSGNGSGTGTGSSGNDGNDDGNDENQEPSDSFGDDNDHTIPIVFNPKPKPCEDLKEKSEDTEFVNKMKEMRLDAFNTVESGYIMYDNDPPYSEKQFGGLDAGGSYIDLAFDPARAAVITGFMHCHLNNAEIKNFAVFSLDDLIAFGTLVENSTVPLEKLTMYVTSNKGTFALKIKNKASFIAAIDKIYDSKKIYDNIFRNRVNEDLTPSDQVKGFLSFFKASGLSTSEVYELYQCDYNFSNWKKVGIDQNNNLTYTNC
jgi:hypothetical protein